MGSNFKDYAFAESSGSTVINVFVGLLIAAVLIFVAYKLVLVYSDRRKWGWFTQLCKEKGMRSKETEFLKTIVVKKKITSVDDLFGSIYSLNLPTPIKKKLLWDDAPSRAAAR